jgi:hypothetical protein
MTDVYRIVLDYTSRYVLSVMLSLPSVTVLRCKPRLVTFFIMKVLRRIQAVSGLYGMVAPCDKTCLLHPVVGTFTAGDVVRVVQPAEVIGTSPWLLEEKKSCGLRMSYEIARAKSVGTLTVRVCLCTTVFREERNYIATHFRY